MKFTSSIISAAFLAVGLVSAASIPVDIETSAHVDGEVDVETRGWRPPVCVKRSQATPWFRAYNAQSTDHFYTTNPGELGNAVRNLGYKPEGIAAYIFPRWQPSTTPLFRMYNSDNQDHFYTADLGERAHVIANLDYRDEGVAGYVYSWAICGSVPLYRLYSGKGSDHFYTTSASERDSARRSGYQVEGIVGFVFLSRF